MIKWKKIWKDSVIVKYLIGIMCFLLTSFWIWQSHLGMDILEVCVVRYGVVLAVAIGVHYMFCVKGIRLNLKKYIPFICHMLIGVIISGIIAFVLNVTDVTNGFSKRMLFLFFMIYVFGYVIYSFMKGKLDDNRAIALTIFVVGTIFAFELPAATGSSWDDQIHYMRALQVSQLGESDYSKADERLIGIAYEGGAVSLLLTKKYTKFIDEISLLYDNGVVSGLLDEELSFQVKLSYLPNAVMMLIARGLSLPYPIVFILGRWISVIFYSLIIYIALCNLKSGKIIIATISLFPTNLFLMSSYSYDTWGTGLMILAFSYYIGALQNNEMIGYKRALIMCGIFMLACAAKPIYFCLILMFLFVPKRNLQINLQVWKYRVIVLFTCVLILLSFIAPFLMEGTGGNDMRGGADVNSMEQIMFILSNPMKYTEILLNFLKEYWSKANSAFYIGSFAYWGVAQRCELLFYAAIIINFLDKKECDVMVTNWIRRGMAFVLAFSASVFVATSLYVAYTPVGHYTVNGCQARYLMPILFLVAYFMGDYRIINKFNRYISNRALICVTLMLFSGYSIYSLYQLCISFY